LAAAIGVDRHAAGGRAVGRVACEGDLSPSGEYDGEKSCSGLGEVSCRSPGQWGQIVQFPSFCELQNFV